MSSEDWTLRHIFWDEEYETWVGYDYRGVEIFRSSYKERVIQHLLEYAELLG